MRLFFLSSFLTAPEMCLDLVGTVLACYWNLPFCLFCCFQILKEEISLWWVSMFSQAAVMHPRTLPVLNLWAENQCLMLLSSSLYVWLKKWSDSSHRDFYPISSSFHVGGVRWKSMMTMKEAVFRNMEKHCGMTGDLREIPRGILFPAQKINVNLDFL